MLANVLATMSKKLSKVQMSLNQSLSVLDEKHKELIEARKTAKEADSEWRS